MGLRFYSEIRIDNKGMYDAALTGFKNANKRVGLMLAQALAEEYVEFLAQAIETGQGIMGPPLSPATIARKGHSQPWIETEAMLQALTVFRIGDVFYAGIPPEAMNDRAQPLALIAKILEYGSLTVPARPLFHPTLKRLEPLVPSSIGVTIDDVLAEFKRA